MMALPQIASVYFFGCCGSAFCVRVATGNHVSQSLIMFTEGALEVSENLIQFGGLGRYDRRLCRWVRLAQ